MASEKTIQQVSEESALLASFFLQAPVFVIAFDQSGEVAFANDSAQEVLPTLETELNRLRERTLVAPAPVRTFLGDGSREWSAVAATFTAPGGATYVGVLGLDVTEVRRGQKSVAESHERLRTALEAGFDAFLALEAVRDGDGHIVDFAVIELNEHAGRLLGRSRWEAAGQRFGQIVATDWGQDIVAKYARVVETRESFQEEFAILRGDAGALWLRQQVVPLGDGVAVTARDVSDQKRAEQTMREHARVLENALDGIATADAEGKIDYVNATFASILGRSPAQTIGQPWEIIVRPEDRAVLPDLLRQTLREERAEIELRGDRPDGMPLFLNLVMLPRFIDGDLSGHYVFAMDVTAQRAYEAQLEQQMRLLNEAHQELANRSRALEAANERLKDLATTDGLTGLRNHRFFRERLAEEIARTERYGPPLVVLMLDVDFFKQYNDSYGHPAGDEVLRELATILRAGVRKTDLVARYGGEEFAVVLPQTPLEAARALAERLRVAVETHDWEHKPLSVSIGGAAFGPDYPTAEALVQAADTALYAAKRAGRNRLCFTT